jgi:TRAP-type mannitol/chloroaromatic compound transport system permease small subunit
MLTIAYTLKQNGHVRVDIFYNSMGEKGQAWVNFLGTLFLLLPTCSFILWVSWDYVAVSWAILESSRETGGIPAIFLLKTLIPAMAIMMILQGISQMIKSYIIIKF